MCVAMPMYTYICVYVFVYVYVHVCTFISCNAGMQYVAILKKLRQNIAITLNTCP